MHTQTEDTPSKTARKKAMNDLQKLGMALTALSEHSLKNAPLPDDLRQAVRDYKKITANGALKRQAQYIGRLMRDTDPAPIEDFLAKLRGDHQAHNAFLQRVEHARTKLLAEDDALTDFLRRHPHADASALHTLIRNARREQQQQKPPKNFRALYQELKNVMESQESHHE